MIEPRRAYRQRWTAAAVRGVYPFSVAGVGLCIFGYLKYDNPSLPVAIVFAALFMAVVAWGEMRGVKQGLYESEVGVRCVTFYGTCILPWADLVEFDHRRAGTWDRVYAKLADGEVKVLPAVFQGQRVVWDGGETRNIVGVLNDRLAEVRAANAVVAATEPDGVALHDTS
jgi:Bacterial PH domain